MTAVWFFDTPVVPEISSTRSALVMIPPCTSPSSVTGAAGAVRRSARPRSWRGRTHLADGKCGQKALDLALPAAGAARSRALGGPHQRLEALVTGHAPVFVKRHSTTSGGTLTGGLGPGQRSTKARGPVVETGPRHALWLRESYWSTASLWVARPSTVDAV